MRWRRRVVQTDDGRPPDIASEPTKTRPLEQLYTAVHQLEPLDRTLVMLSLDECSYAQMAEVTGLSVSNIGARLSRAKRKLALLIEDVPYDT